MTTQVSDDSIANRFAAFAATHSADMRRSIWNGPGDFADVTHDDDRADYFYVTLHNGQRFKVEVTEVYDREA